MQEAVQKLTVEIGAKDTSEPAFKSVERKVEQLKHTLGRRSFVSELTEVAVGGGAVAGLSVVSRTAGEILTSTSEFIEKLRESKGSANELTLELAKSLPIIGSLTSGIEAFAGSITGSTASAKRAAEEAQKVKEETAAEAVRKASIKGFDSSLATFINNELNERLGQGPLSELGEIRKDTASRLQGLSPSVAELGKLLGVPADEKAIREKIRELQSQLRDDQRVLAYSGDPALRLVSGNRAAKTKELLADVLPRLDALDENRKRLLKEQGQRFGEVLTDYAVDSFRNMTEKLNSYLTTSTFLGDTAFRRAYNEAVFGPAKVPFLPGESAPSEPIGQGRETGIPFRDPETDAINSQSRDLAIQALQRGIQRLSAYQNVSGYVTGADAGPGMTGVRPAMLERDPRLDEMQRMLAELQKQKAADQADRQEILRVAASILGKFDDLLSAITQ